MQLHDPIGLCKPRNMPPVALPDPLPGAIADDLAARLAAAIMTGELQAGSWLRQGTLGERYGVSRQPVREALRQLQAYGMVEMHPRRGALVRRPSPRDVREAYLVRAELEGLAAALAAERITVSALERLRAAKVGFDDVVTEVMTDSTGGAMNVALWASANDAFHREILEAAGAHILGHSLEALHRMVPRSLSANALHSRRLLRENIVQHANIYDAIESGDEDAARAAMRKHVLDSGELIADWFEREQTPEHQAARRQPQRAGRA
jgi:DNA-binding GntR family transcriptional regulator